MRRWFLVLMLILTGCVTRQGEVVTPSVGSIPAPPSTVGGEITTTTGPVSSTGEPGTTTTLAEFEGLAYEEVARLDFPIQIVSWDSGMSLIATKDGQVWVMEPDYEIRPSPVLDITEQVHNEGERGLLSIAVSEDNSELFVHYSATGGGDTVVSRFTMSDGVYGNEEVLFEHDQPAGNHNGGMLQFGPDGALYLGLGDGGAANDTFGHGQNTDTLLAGIVRIDPFNEGVEPTLFQYGLRNPWRFWIDIGANLIYIADVGQNAFEEINVASFEEGLNYGWSITEGLHCFNPPSDCDADGLTLPVVEVAHGDAGTCSITGGVVSKGAAIPEIQGHYFYSDWCGGYLRSFRYSDGQVTDETDWTEQVGVPGNVVSFGFDSSAEMHVLTEDRVLRVVAERAG